MRLSRRGKVLVTAGTSLIALGGAIFLAFSLTHDHIVGFVQEGRTLGNQWTAYGGSWELSNGVMRNNSYERGAKLLAGSRWAGDYKVEADIALVGNYGDAGLILRARDPAEGVDSYSGFNIGLRTLDNSLILGRADYGWDEYQRLAIPGDIAVNTFYHLTVIAVGCDIGAKVDLPSGESVRAGVSLRRCNRRGLIGLKSYQTPAAWRHFNVAPASKEDLARLMNGQALASYSKGNLHFYDPHVDEDTSIEREALSRKVEVQTTPIAQLELSSSPTDTDHAAVHGVVRLIKPVTYVEDATGSIVIASQDQPALAIGDEVVISGQVSRQSGQLTLRDGHVQILWSDTPAPPLLVTADEAATGLKDGRLVLVTGSLIREFKNEDGSTVFQLSGGGESFSAIAIPAMFIRPPSVRPSSEVEVMGVVRTDSSFAGSSAFAILLSPTEDAVRVVRQAPWWTPARITILFLAIGTAIAISILAYYRFKQHYLLQIMKERQLLAHDLHDTVSQGLAGIGLQLDSVSAYLSDRDMAQLQIERAKTMVHQSHDELRRSVTTLRHQIDAIGDLAHALDRTAQRLVAGGSIRVECKVSGLAQRLPVPVADCFFRIGQEAITNSIHHAGASIVLLHLSYADRLLTMRITDDGNGFAPEEMTAGHGLFGMKKRAEMIGARFEILREPAGMTVSVTSRISHRSRIFQSFTFSDRVTISE